MLLGIVGSEATKFTEQTEQEARELIRSLITRNDTVVSGECHLGGIDIWAKEEALAMGAGYRGFPPLCRAWTCYKERNLKIAQHSEMVVCITVAKLPETYEGMRFDYCYHCCSFTHIKSGGCWTVKQARLMGKPGDVLVVGEKP